MISNHALWLYFATEKDWLRHTLHDLWNALPTNVALQIPKTSLPYRKSMIRKLLLILDHFLLQLFKPNLRLDLRNTRISITLDHLINFLKRVVILDHLLIFPHFILTQLLNLILILRFFLTAAPSHL